MCFGELLFLAPRIKDALPEASRLHREIGLEVHGFVELIDLNGKRACPNPDPFDFASALSDISYRAVRNYQSLGRRKHRLRNKR